MRQTSVSFAIGDILRLPSGRYDAILSRGVLNDFLDDESRDAILLTFARALRPAGVLILDVREWDAAAARKAREPVFRKSIDTDRGKLTFTSVTELDRQNRQLVLSERHSLRAWCRTMSASPARRSFSWSAVRTCPEGARCCGPLASMW
jgi:hypothetical protein